MKQAILAIILLGIFGILLSGGFTLKDPKGLLSSRDVAKVEDATPSAAEKNLQIKNRPVTIIPPSTTCTSSTKVAVNFLLDTSGSMGPTSDSDSKIIKLKAAVNAFGDKLHTDDLVGIQAFSGLDYNAATGEDLPTCRQINNTPACEVLAFGQYNQLTYNAAVEKLVAGGITQMEDGFKVTEQVIQDAKNTTPQAQDYNWVMIFLSDGIPNDTSDDRYGPDDSQDPRKFTEVNAIRNLPVRVITVGLDLASIIVGARPGREDFTIDRGLVPGYAKILLQEIASQPPANDPTQKNYHDSPKADQLASIYDDIAYSICR